MTARLDNPDPVRAITKEALNLRRRRADQPAKATHMFAKQTATHECYDWLMRQTPTKGAA